MTKEEVSRGMPGALEVEVSPTRDISHAYTTYISGEHSFAKCDWRNCHLAILAMYLW